MKQAILALMGVAAFWGSGPLFYASINYVPAMEVLAYRVLWAAVFYIGALAVTRRFGDLAPIWRNARSRKLIAWAALFISLNWGIFIYAVGHGHATQSSIAYYIYPLLNFVIGYLVFSERLSRAQMLAAGLAVFAVLLLTYGVGQVPFFALAIAASFAGYNAIKRALPNVPTLASVCAETLILVPLAALYLAIWGTTFNFSAPDALFTHGMLFLCGPYTAIPLILFGFAAQRLSLSTIGMLSYLNPSLQLMCAALVLGEPLTAWHWAALSIIWLAIALYLRATLFKGRAAA